MFLSEILNQLTYGELNQLSLAGSQTSGFLPQDLIRVIPSINLGLTELHKRFGLKSNEVVVQQYDNVTKYELSSKHAVSNKPDVSIPVVPPVPILPDYYYYIEDSIFEPFKDDVLRIEKVINEIGETLYLNQDEPSIESSTKYWSVHTPSYNVVQVPYPEKENQMIVTYRADHYKIPINGIDPDKTEVYIPHTLLESLLLYIAARIHLSRGTEISLAEGNAYMTKFEASILKVTELNLINTNDTENSKFFARGWV